MGVHMLPKLTGMRLVVQLLVPGLEERARALPPLCSIHHTLGQHPSCLLPHCYVRLKCCCGESTMSKLTRIQTQSHLRFPDFCQCSKACCMHHIHGHGQRCYLASFTMR